MTSFSSVDGVAVIRIRLTFRREFAPPTSLLNLNFSTIALITKFLHHLPTAEGTYSTKRIGMYAYALCLAKKSHTFKTFLWRKFAA